MTRAPQVILPRDPSDAAPEHVAGYEHLHVAHRAQLAEELLAVEATLLAQAVGARAPLLAAPRPVVQRVVVIGERVRGHERERVRRVGQQLLRPRHRFRARREFEPQHKHGPHGGVDGVGAVRHARVVRAQEPERVVRGLRAANVVEAGHAAVGGALRSQVVVSGHHHERQAGRVDLRERTPGYLPLVRVIAVGHVAHVHHGSDAQPARVGAQELGLRQEQLRIVVRVDLRVGQHRDGERVGGGGREKHARGHPLGRCVRRQSSRLSEAMKRRPRWGMVGEGKAETGTWYSQSKRL
jgi:hypothetical protein